MFSGRGLSRRQGFRLFSITPKCFFSRWKFLSHRHLVVSCKNCWYCRMPASMAPIKRCRSLDLRCTGDCKECCEAEEEEKGEAEFCLVHSQQSALPFVFLSATAPWFTLLLHKLGSAGGHCLMDGLDHDPWGRPGTRASPSDERHQGCY